jgi:hypothetical protein
MSEQATAPAKMPQPEPDYSKLKFQFLQDESEAVEQPTTPAKRFIRKHRHWLLFLSTAIVFGTFVVREDLRERVKDETTAIQQMEDILLANDEPITLVPLKIGQPSYGRTDWVPFDIFAARANLSALANQIARLQREMRVRENKSFATDRLWEEWTDAKKTLDKETYADLMNFDEDLKRLADDITKFKSNRRYFKAIDIPPAETELVRLKYWDKLCGRTLYGLVTFGLLLNLLSAWAGVSLAGGED